MSAVIVPAPPGMVALQDLDEVTLELEVVCLQPLETSGEGDTPFEAWVIFDDEMKRASELPHFAGFGWRPAVVGAVPGAGWKVDDGDGPEEVEAWAVRSDGSAVAVTVYGQIVRVVDPHLRSVQFIAPGWRGTK